MTCMNAAETQRLVPLWSGVGSQPYMEDPWAQRGEPFGQGISHLYACPGGEPDFGWRLAQHLARTGRKPTLLKRPAYRWVLAAVNLLKGGKSAARRLGDLRHVSAAVSASKSESARAILNAALMARDASAASVAKALDLDPLAVEAYDCLFFNVLDRKGDAGYLTSIIHPSDNLAATPFQTGLSEAENLLLIGYEGSIADVMVAIGRVDGEGDQTVSELAEKVQTKVLSSGLRWLSNPSNRRLAPPAVVSQAISFAKSKSDAVVQLDGGENGCSLGDSLRQELLGDGTELREYMNEKFGRLNPPPSIP